MSCATVIFPIEVLPGDHFGRRRDWSDEEKARILLALPVPLLAVLVSLAIPFGNALPVLAVAIIAISLAEHDGRMIIIRNDNFVSGLCRLLSSCVGSRHGVHLADSSGSGPFEPGDTKKRG